MERHVQVSAWLRIIGSASAVLLAIAVMLFLRGAAAIVSELEDSGQTSGVTVEVPRSPDAAADDSLDALSEVPVKLIRMLGAILPLVLVLLAVPGLVTGWGLLTYRPWAPMVNTVLSAFDLLNIPIGTAFGAYSNWVMLHPDTVALFKAGGPLSRYPTHF